MKIIRWLLSHTVLILLIVAVIYGYMFWGNLAGEDTPAGKALAYLSNEFEEIDEFVAAIKAKQEKSSQQKSSEMESLVAHQRSFENDVPAVAESVNNGAAIQLAETQVVEQVVNQAAEKNNFTAPVVESSGTGSAAINDASAAISERKDIEQQQVSSSYSDTDAAVKQNSAGIIEASVEPVEVDDVVTSNLQNLQSASAVSNVQAASNGATEGHFVSTEIEKQLDNVDKNGRLIDETQQGDIIRTSWIVARESFYQRKYELSEQNYQKIIDSTEDNFDAYGELGNVYFNQGKNEQAASAYFQAAAILVRKGQVNRALSLMGLLRHLDKSKANELQKLIDSNVS